MLNRSLQATTVECVLLTKYLVRRCFISTENILQRVCVSVLALWIKRIVQQTKTCFGFGLNASQTLWLIRTIPLILGDVVPNGSSHELDKQKKMDRWIKG